MWKMACSVYINGTTFTSDLRIISSNCSILLYNFSKVEVNAIYVKKLSWSVIELKFNSQVQE
jgi:hypothetical protein